jgi:membrane fusion protein (multidrug efflux system)
MPESIPNAQASRTSESVSTDPELARAARSRRRLFRPGKPRWGRLTFVLVPLLLFAAVCYYWGFMRPYESTDDAFIEANIIPIVPRISGQTVKLLVRDNQAVHRGDLLLEIDPRDFEAKVAEADAGVAAARTRLEQAEAQVSSDKAKVDQEKATLAAAETEAQRAEAELKRYESLPNAAVSRSQVDTVKAQAISSAANVAVSRSRVRAAELQVTLSQAGVQAAKAELQRNQAILTQGRLELSYTKIAAPEDGFVTHRTVERGAYVQSGQSLLALVPAGVWVVANFKETQLKNMHPGQVVQIRVDAYAGRKFLGHVDSIQRGSGARFSVLPPENAAGNYVKVVQRVPVKILFDDPPDPNFPFGPGMSVEPKVRVIGGRQRSRTGEIAERGP